MKRKAKKNLSAKELCVSEANAKRPLYSFRDDVELHPELLRYDEIKQVREMTLKIYPAKLTPKRKKISDEYGLYVIKREDGSTYQRPGLVNKIKKRYYPNYIPTNPQRRSKKNPVKKPGAGKTGGSTADAHLHLAVENKGRRPPRCSQYARAALEWWEENGHELQASQLPVNILPNKCATQGDYFTIKKGLDGKPELWYWELKCGFPPGAHVKHGQMSAPLQDVKISPFNIWELQRQFTHWAYEEELGMKIHASRVIHVYKEEGKGMQVVARKIPSWCVGMSKAKHYKSL